MRYIKVVFLLAFLCVYSKIYAQLSTHEQPISFNPNLKLTVSSKSSKSTITMPLLDMTKIEKEDNEDKESDIPPRFGYSHIVNYDLNNSGTWFELPNGDKLWQLNVICPKALSINFCYDKFWIPEGGKFFIYSKDKKHTIGAFTSKNNKGDRNNIRGFATELIYGDDVVLEYYQPKEVTNDAIISIEYIVHGYRYIRDRELGFGASDSCMININCNEGLDWQYEKKAVARVVSKGDFYTGSLINTASLNGEPFFLTANHCIKSNGKDAIDNPNYDYAVFYWDYEFSSCANENIEPNIQTTSGAVVVANPYNTYGENSDFALLRLTEDPKNLTNYKPYYLGWNRSSLIENPEVCIHHPKGDVKKISILSPIITPSRYPYDPFNVSQLYWKVSYIHGVVDPGSSGSALLDVAHRTIGQLRGGNTENCNYSEYAFYGRFDVSWTGNNNHTDSIHRRLDCWLDSLNTEEPILEGLFIISSSVFINTSQQIYCNIRIKDTGLLIIESDVELKGNGRIIVDSGCSLIIDGCTLSVADVVLKPGSSLEILNGGILESRNGFKAPVGAYVYIDEGQIL